MMLRSRIIIYSAGDVAKTTKIMSVKKRRAIKLLREAMAETTDESGSEDLDGRAEYVRKAAVVQPTSLQPPVANPTAQNSGAGILGIFVELGHVSRPAIKISTYSIGDWNLKD